VQLGRATLVPAQGSQLKRRRLCHFVKVISGLWEGFCLFFFISSTPNSKLRTRTKQTRASTCFECAHENAPRGCVTHARQSLRQPTQCKGKQTKLNLTVVRRPKQNPPRSTVTYRTFAVLHVHGHRVCGHAQKNAAVDAICLLWDSARLVDPVHNWSVLSHCIAVEIPGPDAANRRPLKLQTRRVAAHGSQRTPQSAS
jgi:hypothetical protein